MIKTGTYRVFRNNETGEIIRVSLNDDEAMEKAASEHA
jgi:hypothetical protein